MYKFYTTLSRQFAFPQIELFSFGHDLDISPRLFPPAARCPALPAPLYSYWWACGAAQIGLFIVRCYMQVELSIHWTKSGTCA